MAKEQQIKVPDIGGASQVDVIEVLVKVGDVIAVDTPLITLETEKASMEIPAPLAGTVKEIKVKVGDKVTEGDLILIVNSDMESKGVEQSVLSESVPTSPAIQKLKKNRLLLLCL